MTEASNVEKAWLALQIKNGMSWENAIKELQTLISFHKISNREMSNGMRDMSRTPLTNTEIDFVKLEIERIKADPNIFIFNDKSHISQSTCYNYIEDKVYVTRNVFPDVTYGSTHPRDIMSVGAVLAHEYYGHRKYREEYLKDKNIGNNYHTTELWKDECRASLTAAHDAAGLTPKDRSDLVMDAIKRAEESGHYIKMDNFMKEVLYGYSADERKISGEYETPKFVDKASVDRLYK